MSMLTVRNLDPEVKAEIQRRAARKGRSMEAEVRSVDLGAGGKRT